jgi:phosphoglycolate phosphatase
MNYKQYIEQNEIVIPEAILFDWDNTLVDTEEVIYKSLHRMFIEMEKKPFTREEIGTHCTRSARDYFPEIFGDDWEKAVEIYRGYYGELHLEQLRIIDGVHDMLEVLSSFNMYMAVISNKGGYMLRQEVTHAGFDKYFSKIIGAKDAEYDKPHTAPVDMALDGSGIESGNHVWFIGDSITDMECAYNAQMTPIYYGTNSSINNVKDKFPPKKFITDYKDLVKLVSDLKLL